MPAPASPAPDILGVGAVTVDDLIYVAEFPRPDAKMHVAGRERQPGGLTGTALVAAISVVELTYTAQRFIGSTYKPFEMFLISGVLYMIIIYVTGRAITWLDRRARIV